MREMSEVILFILQDEPSHAAEITAGIICKASCCVSKEECALNGITKGKWILLLQTKQCLLMEDEHIALMFVGNVLK